MKIAIEYDEMTPAQKLPACWHDFCDADPVPPEFAEDMEAAGYTRLRSVTKQDLQESFAAERGIYPGGSVWELTKAGHTALAADEVGR